MYYGGSIVQARIHRNLQSKDFQASLLICGNFQITAFRVHSSWEPKIILKTVPHPKQSGHIIVLGVGRQYVMTSNL